MTIMTYNVFSAGTLNPTQSITTHLKNFWGDSQSHSLVSRKRCISKVQIADWKWYAVYQISSTTFWLLGTFHLLQTFKVHFLLQMYHTWRTLLQRGMIVSQTFLSPVTQPRVKATGSAVVMGRRAVPLRQLISCFKPTYVDVANKLTSGYATMVHGRGCNPHRSTTTFANLKLRHYDVIDDVITRKL